MQHPNLTRAEEALKTAGDLMKAGLYREAAAAVEPFLGHADGRVRCRAAVAAVAAYSNLNDLERALAVIEQAAASAPAEQASALQLHRGRILARQGRWEAAVSAYQRYLVDCPGSHEEPECYLGLGWCYAQLGRAGAGLSCTARAILGFRQQEKYTGAVEAYLSLVSILMAAGRNRPARAGLDRLFRYLRQHPDARLRARALVAAARLELADGQPRTAAMRVAQAMEFLDSANPGDRLDYVWAVYYQAAAAGALGQRLEALGLARNALAMGRLLPGNTELCVRSVALIRAHQI